MELSSRTMEMGERANRLYLDAGRPKYHELAAAAELAGLCLSTSSITHLRQGKGWPRWATVEAYVLACRSRASGPLTAADLAEWRAWYNSTSRRIDARTRGAGPPIEPAVGALVGDVHRQLSAVIRRFARVAGTDGDYRFLSGPDVATAARNAKTRLDGLSDTEKAFLLTAGLFVGRGDGFGLYEFLPDPHAPWAMSSFAPLLSSQTYRTGRYRAAIVLQQMAFPDRDELTHEALSRSCLRTWQELSYAIRSSSVSAFIADPVLCYDYGIWEAERRSGLLSAAAGIREIYSRWTPSGTTPDTTGR